MFRECDKDGSGSISTDEVKTMLSSLGIPSEEIETLVTLHDKNQDGELQYEEFVSFVLHTWRDFSLAFLNGRQKRWHKSMLHV